MSKNSIGELLSVNVGRPREITWEGRTVRTAIWKDPVEGPRMVRRLNIDGDDQADRAAHGGEHRAVFVYQIDSYRYWKDHLGRDDLTPGQFGENFTVDGLADADVCIGDQYAIGDAIFEVTQPRVTCFRVGIRMAEPRMPSLLVEHHRPGFYVRVLREGAVTAGDAITRLRRGPEQLTVADIDGLLYLPGRSTEQLARAPRIPALSEGWKSSFRTLLEQARGADGTGVRPPAWAGFQRVKVIERTEESTHIVSLQLAPIDRPPADAAAHPGQYLTVRLRDGHETPDGPAVIRSYSLSAIDPGHYRISVKLEPGGAGSSRLQQLRVGDFVDAAAPRGSFTLRDSDDPAVLISAGVGATPVLAMLRALAALCSEREVWWIHGARNAEEHAFAREVDELLQRLPNAHRLVSYSQPERHETPGTRFDAIGRITGATLTTARVPVAAEYCLCGPDAFMRSLSAAIIARGTAPENVAMERFGAAAAIAPGIAGERDRPHAPTGPAGPGPDVTFSRSGLTVPWDPRYGSLLELAEACDVPVSFGCRTGVCHYCETGLLTGSTRYSSEPLEAPDGDHVLVCCARPLDAVTLEL